MSDKGWNLSNYVSALFHLNSGNSAMPLNPSTKRPPYVVFFVLYKFCFVWNCISFNFTFTLFWNWKKNGSCLKWASSWVGSILQSYQKNMIPAGLSCKISDERFNTKFLSLTLFSPLFWNSKCWCIRLKANRNLNVSFLIRAPFWVGLILLLFDLCVL